MLGLLPAELRDEYLRAGTDLAITCEVHYGIQRRHTVREKPTHIPRPAPSNILGTDTNPQRSPSADLLFFSRPTISSSSLIRPEETWTRAATFRYAEIFPSTIGPDAVKALRHVYIAFAPLDCDEQRPLLRAAVISRTSAAAAGVPAVDLRKCDSGLLWKPSLQVTVFSWGGDGARRLRSLISKI